MPTKLIRIPGQTIRAEITPEIEKKKKLDPNEYYRILDLDPNEEWTFKEIRTAFRGKAKKCHPDGSEPDLVMYEQIQVAWEVLRDPDLRDKYDNLTEGYQWVDKFLLEEIIKKMASSKGAVRDKEPLDLVDKMKESLEPDREPMQILFSSGLDPNRFVTHSYFYWEGESPPPDEELREEWIRAIQDAMITLGYQDREIKIGFSWIPHHVERPWGKILMVSGKPNPPFALFLVRDFFQNF